MSIAWDATTQDPPVTGSPETLIHPVGAAGEHRIALLAVGWRTDTGITLAAITFAGQVPVLYGNISTGTSTGRLYYLLAPPTGPQTYSVTWSGGIAHVIVCSTYTGVDQTNPFLNAALTASRATPGVLNINVPSQTGNLVVDFLSMTSTGAGATAVVGAGQTQRANQNAAAGGGSQGDGMSEEVGAATVAMSWTVGAGTHRLIAGSLRPFVEPRTRAIKYFTNIWDPTHAIRDGQGARLESNEVHADEWIQADGFTLGESIAYDDFIKDPTKSRIVSLTHRRGAVDIKTSTNQFGDVIVARAAAGRM